MHHQSRHLRVHGKTRKDRPCQQDPNRSQVDSFEWSLLVVRCSLFVWLETRIFLVYFTYLVSNLFTEINLDYFMAVFAVFSYLFSFSLLLLFLYLSLSLHFFGKISYKCLLSKTATINSVQTTNALITNNNNNYDF